MLSITIHSTRERLENSASGLTDISVNRSLENSCTINTNQHGQLRVQAQWTWRTVLE